MAFELHSIQTHLWILTAFLAVIVLASFYCNYSRIKEKKETSAYEYMNYLWEAEKYKELLEYTTDYLKSRPNNGDALFFHSVANSHFKRFEIAKASAAKLASHPGLREQSKKLLNMIDELIGDS